MPAELFPLPLRPFEELFVHDDDAPDYPAVFSGRFEFDGLLDRGIAELALQDVISRQPMLNCRLEDPANDSMAWMFVDHARTSGRVEAGKANRLQSFDLRNEQPFRLGLESRKTEDAHDQTIVTFQFHHAAFDGVGALTVVNDWMKSYDLLSDTPASARSRKKNRLDPSMLEQRCQAGLSWRERLRLAPWCWLSLIGFVNFFKNRSIPLVPMEHVGNVTTKTEDTPILSATVDEESTARLKARTAELAVTLNDLIAVDLLASVKQWQLDRESTPKGSHLRITIPINERSVRHRRMPACNHCTMISLDRRPNQISLDSNSDQFRALAQQVHHEIDTVREWRLSLSFWSTLGLFQRLGGIKKWFATRKCRSTCVLTNLGQLGQRLRLATNEDGQVVVGNVPLSHVEFAAPIRFGTAVAFSVFVYRRQLNITMNYDRKSLSREDASDLLNELKQRLSV